MTRTTLDRATTLDPVTLSVFVSALAGIAEEMGAVLVRSSYSSNIKERRDCSCALFDESGRMVAQAEHIPVHLGAMYDSVAAVRVRSPDPGDVFVLNDPYAGGTHLPDVTLVTPVAAGDEIIGYAVSRAHHSDVGGMTPGSMPSESTSIFQEGIVIPPIRLVRRGRLVEDVLELVLANVRTPDIRRVDLLAQVAANAVGAERLHVLVEGRGLAFVRSAFDEVIAYGARRTREVLRAVPDGTYAAEGEIEGDGVVDVDIPIRVAVTIEGESMIVDLTGTSGPVRGNVNCPLSVARSACLFALRVLLPEDVPINAGSAAPLDVRVPEASLVNARRPAAVVAGNVETSQRLADVVLAALGRAVDLPAAGQGTMNNLIIGGIDWTYYETIGGGQGASSAGPGASGVHVGMSNTLNTPIEALELEFPLRVERYQLRYGSGGAGVHSGGDGIERRVRVLEPATLSLLSDRRRHAPAGKAGGSSGACGENAVDGRPVSPKHTSELEPGQTVSVLTPGGGGWGEAKRATTSSVATSRNVTG
jgi:N-methylhydantoinase B